MNASEQYNGLNGLTVDRQTLTKLVELAKKQKNQYVSRKIVKILNENPDDSFDIEIKNFIEPAGLNAIKKKTVKKSKTIKLSAYTIASNCTDLTDAKDGFYEIDEAEKKYKKLGKKIPAFWKIRQSKLVDRIKFFEKKQGLSFPEIINDAWFPKYKQFKSKPKEAIKHLLKVKKGDCLNAFYRDDIGFIDLVWGSNDINNKGFGLKHIYEKHGKEIEQLGFKIEDFLPIIIQFGQLKITSNNKDKIILQGQMFKIIISKIAYNNNKKTEKVFVLSAFDLRPLWKKEKSRGLNGTYDGISFAKKPLLSKTLDFNKNIVSKTKLKSFSVGKIKSGNLIEAQTNGIPRDGQIKTLYNNKCNKNNTKNQNSGLNFTVTEPKPVITPKNSNDLMNRVFDELPINADWQQLMQSPASNMKIAIWGAPKNGKTSGALQLAEYLTNFGTVLYNFADQGFNKSTQDLWRLSGLANNNCATPSDIDTVAALEKEVATGKYKFVFIDMISEYIRKEKIRPEQFKDRFIKKYPDVSFVLIFEVTKGGNFKGDQGWTHLVDAIMTVDDFIISNRGRYGTGDKIIWHQGAKKFNPKKYHEILTKKQLQIEQTSTQKLKFKEN